MAPCNSNVITPRMIRKGQIQIGDKIEFEPAAHVAASTESVYEPAREAVDATQSQSASYEAAPTAAAVHSSASGTVPASEAAASVEASALPHVADANAMAPDAVTAAVDTASLPRAAMPQGNPTPSYIGRNTADGAQQSGGAFQPNNAGGAQQPNATLQSNTASIPLIYQNMTDYVTSLESTGQQSPSFSVPSSPLVPPEYEQTIDYDSVQYMNGFLRTQIGRYMRVEQLIGSDTTEDRYGFLVGVGNNYLLMQDISNGNISVVDLYSVKFAYIYFGEPVFPNIPFGDSGR